MFFRHSNVFSILVLEKTWIHKWIQIRNTTQESIQVCFKPKFEKIHAVIQCCGSVTIWYPVMSGSGALTNGSWFGSGSRRWPSKRQVYLLITFWSYIFIIFRKVIKSQNSRSNGFTSYFSLMIEGSGFVPVPLNNLSGSGRQKHTDLDPQSAVIKNEISKLYKTLPVIQSNMEFVFYVICHNLGSPGSESALRRRIQTNLKEYGTDSKVCLWKILNVLIYYSMPLSIN